ncbi:glutaredoxin domain-containing protein [Pseudohalocynthiibacter sp. F2068]|jgi:glutaredoxin 3|uniref:glutaredoxin domain-containing protein n=1 Tax=Pseudohalocynthiibacter sp. F2068 TaxID=2926418 RepID=UPI001FF3099A|nr:glutaredoxin domain-containing protein [Pseudohalocynthiibacter sp. F2068]MCK0103797.1 glutaredoxin 3 [Pseudohalocynthiibacter sp. F2068]
MKEVEIFTGPGCDYCVAAKQLLVSKNFSFRERDVSIPEVMLEMRDRLPRAKTIPQIFIDGQHVGGFEDFQEKLQA